MFLPYRQLTIDDVGILTCLTKAETQRLRELAAGQTILEVGSAHGWSTCNLAQVANSVVAVDVHDETAAHAAPNSLAILNDNLQALDLAGKVDVRTGWSKDALPRLRREGALFSGVFIDGDHSYEGCAYDLKMGWRMLRYNGFLAVHDYDENGHCPDVKPAVDTFAAGLSVLDPELVDTLWVVREAVRIVVTGSSGYIGSRLTERLRATHDVLPVDVSENIMSSACLHMISEFEPDLIYHLAAHKYATRGETDPAGTAELNIIGTSRIVDLGFPVVLASTCKAGDAVTCYGASKLIAERIVLNAGGRVLRLVNVIGSTGSVAEIWDGLPDAEPLPVTDCSRIWITIDAAVDAFVKVSVLPSGKYIPAGLRLTVSGLASHLHPDRPQRLMPLRRGDRRREPLRSNDERVTFVDSQLYRIENLWDDQATQVHDRHSDDCALDIAAHH